MFWRGINCIFSYGGWPLSSYARMSTEWRQLCNCETPQLGNCADVQIHQCKTVQMVKHWAVQGYQQSSNVCALCNAQCAWMSVVQSLQCIFSPLFCARTGAEIFSCLGLKPEFVQMCTLCRDVRCANIALSLFRAFLQNVHSVRQTAKIFLCVHLSLIKL